MKVKRSGRKAFLYGPLVIVVKGSINRQILSGVEHLGKYDQKEVRRALERGGEVAIPIRKEASLDEAVDALKSAASSSSD